MRFGSVCSGIEAASVAWPFWEAAWFSEIEPFPCAVLKHHYPEIPNHGDMTTLPDRILSGEVEAPDVFCGGTPCQAFSVAGNRKSLDDARGNLSLTFCEIADAIDSVRHAAGKQPSIIFWENVPGVLNTTDNAFGCFLGELAGETVPLQPPGGRWTDAGCVFGPKRAIAWRVLDAQYFGLAQRRRRVFVVASSREGFNPSEILLEFNSLRRDTAPSRQAGQGIAGDAERGFGCAEISPTVTNGPPFSRTGNERVECDALVVTHPHVFKIRGGCEGGGKGYLGQDEQAFTITTGHDQQVVVPVAYKFDSLASNSMKSANPVSGCNQVEVSCTIDTTDPNPSKNQGGIAVLQPFATQYAVRRLTPVECERLQGFPDNYTNIPWRKKPESPDGPRYKALGNSWAVPVVRWIGERINNAVNRL